MSQYFKIPKGNSIRYSNVRLLNELKNDENTLSRDSFNEFSYIDIQKYLTKDIITNQFRSAYTTNKATITDENGLVTNLTVIKKTTNIGRQLRLDGHYYNYNNGSVYTGIYFTVGSYYTYNTSTPVTGSHTLNGTLPEFAIIGQSVEIVGIGTYIIDRIIYDEDVDSNVILITRTHTGIEVDSQIQSQYDLLEYEVYEFDADFLTFLNELYITITVSESSKRTKTAKSEQIEIQTSYKNTLEIISYNNVNTEILWTTGIQIKIRPLYYKVVAVSPNENEINLTDDTAILIDSSIYNKNKYYFRELSNERMRQLKIILSSDIVIINEEGYVVDGVINNEYMENTNQYLLDATMNKTDINYYVDISLVLASAHRTRVEALASGEVVSFQCLLNEYDTNY